MPEDHRGETSRQPPSPVGSRGTPCGDGGRTAQGEAPASPEAGVGSTRTGSTAEGLDWGIAVGRALQQLTHSGWRSPRAVAAATAATAPATGPGGQAKDRNQAVGGGYGVGGWSSFAECQQARGRRRRFRRLCSPCYPFQNEAPIGISSSPRETEVLQRSKGGTSRKREPPLSVRKHTMMQGGVKLQRKKNTFVKGPTKE